MGTAQINTSANVDQPLKGRDSGRLRRLRNKSISMTSNLVNTMISQNGQDEQLGAVSGNTTARSMSRYRRRANSVSVNGDATQKISSDPQPLGEPPLPPVPTIPRQIKTGHTAQKEGDGPAIALDPPPPRQLRHTDTTRKHLRRSMMDSQSRPSTASDESHRRRLASRDGRRRRYTGEEEAAMRGEEAAWLDAETNRKLAEQKRQDLQRLETQLSNAQRSAIQSPKPRSPVIEKFAFLTKGRKNKDGMSPGLSPTSPTNNSVEFGSRATNFERTRTMSASIQPGGKGIVPQTEVPTSAINSRERNVMVRCKQHTFTMEITPETTPVDVIFRTSRLVSYDLEISPANCVVTETYSILGLERRIRRYERIRDVMNSWDRDTQNQLVVSVSESKEQDWDLDIASVPKSDQPPSGFQLYMYHSNRPGKWNKRWITLLDNGQIFCAKKPNANSTDKDTTSLCRLSDYDIYTPTESQMRRHLKPPKRYCFAVKSQEKTTVFLNTENYVQYFCTEDPKVAAQFKGKVHGWRSWYLVDRRPQPRKVSKVSIPKTDEKPPQIAPVKHTPKKSVNVAAMDGHRLRISVDETPYSLGEFQPLLDLKRFDKRLSQFGKDFLPSEVDASTMPKEIPSQFRPGVKDEKDGENDRKLIDTITPASDSAFTGTGLLGEGYDERKQALIETENIGRGRQPTRDEAFTDGPSLLNKKPATLPQPPESPSWFPSAIEHSARQRSISTSRPSTSSGVIHRRRSSRSDSSCPPPPPLSRKFLPHEHPHPLSSQPTGLSHSNRRERPKPLVNLEPTFQEPPQWSKDKIGHGVKAPEGMRHLIDLITVPNSSKPNGSGHLEPPPRSTMRRPPNTAPLPLSRARSKSAGAPPPKSPRVGDIPPVPLLPGLLGNGAKINSPRARENASERDSQERGRTREREREYTPNTSYNSVSGRMGTLKVV
ncbi:hypothetical protein F4779DRAFT_575062 [Xylariaceae sp. FL0662B]|nr:hypothetical protein F4779DRAFT_575062 [Xylariaceae sp. FL0662B]